MITREAIVREARALKGVRFLHQGADPATGIDCRGLLLCVARALGHTLSQAYRSNYARRPDAAEFRAALSGELEEIPFDELREGDVVFIRWPREREATHAGIVCQGPHERMLIHARSNSNGFSGSVVEEPYKRWEKYVTAVFRFKGVEAHG